MITVRYPSGLAITYNEAYFFTHGEGTWVLCTKDPSRGGRKVAFIQASAGVTVEFQRPCVVQHQGRDAGDLIEQLADDISLLRKGKGRDLQRIKLALTDFDARDHNWKS